MANPKITLSVDQECMDTLNKAIAAINRFCDSCAALHLPSGYLEHAESEIKAMDLSTGSADVIPAAETASADVAVPVAPVTSEPVPFPFQMPAVTAQTAPAQPAAPQMPTMPFTAPAAPAAPQMPTTQPTFTMEQLGRAGLELSQRGVNVAAIMANEFRITSLNQMPVEQYPVFAARLRQLGANI